MSCMRSVMVSADRIAILILAAVAVIAGITFRDYGLGWDDYTHSQYGDLLLKLYGSRLARPRARSLLRQSLQIRRRLRHGGGARRQSAAVRIVRDAAAGRGRHRHRRAVRHLAHRPPHRRGAPRAARAP